MKKKEKKLLTAKDDQGKAVDWWFIYKVAGKSSPSNYIKAKGTEYVYYDSNFLVSK